MGPPREESLVLFWHLDIITIKIQGDCFATAQAADRHWHHHYEARFAAVHNEDHELIEASSNNFSQVCKARKCASE